METGSIDASSITTVWCGRDGVRTRSFDSCARAFVRSFVRSCERRRAERGGARARDGLGLTRRSLDRFRRGRTPVVRACAPTCARFHRLCVRVRSRANETRRVRLATARWPWAATTAGSRAGSPRARMPGASPRILRPISTAWWASVFVLSRRALRARTSSSSVHPRVVIGRSVAAAPRQRESRRHRVDRRARASTRRARRETRRENRREEKTSIHPSIRARAHTSSRAARARCVDDARDGALFGSARSPIAWMDTFV